MNRTCDQCGKRLITQRSGARFCNDICKARWHNAERSKQGTTAKRISGGSEPDAHALADARAAQEATKLKSHWSQVIYQGIVERLKQGTVHADDLEALLPANEEERTMCRKLVGAQFGSLASRHYIFEKERRKSSVPTRKGAKSGVFEFTRKGRDRLVGNRTGASGGTTGASAVSGENPAGASSDTGQGSSSPSARASVAAHSGGTPQGDPGALTGGVGEPRPSCEQIGLLPEPSEEAWAA